MFSACGALIKTLEEILLFFICNAGTAILHCNNGGTITGINVLRSFSQLVQCIFSIHGAAFAQINAVETIAHRGLQNVMKNGHRAHSSEFSVITAFDTVKPLKALTRSNHASYKLAEHPVEPFLSLFSSLFTAVQARPDIHSCFISFVDY